MKNAKVNLKCWKCGKEFMIEPYFVSEAKRLNDKNLIRCPECVYEYFTEKFEEDTE